MRIFGTPLLVAIVRHRQPCLVAASAAAAKVRVSRGYLVASPVLNNYWPWCSVTSRTSNERIGGEGNVLLVRRRWGGSLSGLRATASSPPAPPASRLALSRVVAGFNPEGMRQGLVSGVERG
jgi:hypothetical protein